MKPTHDRRSFLRVSGSLAGGALLLGSGLPLFAQAPTAAPAATPTPAPARKPPPRPPAMDPEKVQAIVGQAHRSLEAVIKLVEEYPLLANACWDWGGGDFETALQAAAHTGGRDIAEFLIAHNARPDLYAHGMLGNLDAIKAAFALNPRIYENPGPHGFTLLHCVKTGGEKAKPVYDWMIAQGVPEVMHRPLPLFWPPGTEPKQG